MYCIQKGWHVVSQGTQENQFTLIHRNNRTLLIILQFLQLGFYSSKWWKLGRQVISLGGTACVLHNGLVHAGSRRVLLCIPPQCWIWSWLGLHMSPDAPCSAHSVQSAHTWLVLFLEGPPCLLLPPPLPLQQVHLPPGHWKLYHGHFTFSLSNYLIF